MKKVIKSRIFLILITMIVCISGTLYAANEYYATDILYNTSDGKSMSVSEALNELYNKSNLNGLSFINFGFTAASSNTVPYGSVGLIFKNCDAKEIYISERKNLNTYIYVSNDPIILGGKFGITYSSEGTLKLLGSWGNTYDVSQYKYVAIGWSFTTVQYKNNSGFSFVENIVTIN